MSFCSSCFLLVAGKWGKGGDSPHFDVPTISREIIFGTIINVQ